jgi:hypothetical protein
VKSKAAPINGHRAEDQYTKFIGSSMANGNVYGENNSKKKKKI